MKGWLFTKTHEPLVLTEKPDPVPGKGEVLVDIKATGLCLSDVHFLDDEAFMAFTSGVPCYMGHECAGVVEAIGEGVTNVKVGDRIAVFKVVNAATNECIGITQDGGYATKILVHDHMCVPIPEKVTFAQAAGSTCAGVTAYHAVFTQGGAKPGLKIGIIGIGGLGQFGVGMAAAVGCDVYASSRSQKGKDIAKALGAKEVASSITEFADLNLDVIIDFAGARKTLNDAIRTVRYGGTVVIAGMMENDLVIENANAVDSIIIKDICLKGCNGGGSIEEQIDIFNIMSNHGYSPSIEVIPFDDIERGIELLRAGKVEGKLVAIQD